ncbi:hypothetical protein MUK42_37716 [Musa troglodytarum]|uniref:Uncharacterized protein n=1 Tax=Musa troglodytarum TaxID=320322 RepID=A0A9E7GEJ6_9LILI|nr:hypothetical protein MUK42_37716 [Musa troglodytarum]
MEDRQLRWWRNTTPLFLEPMHPQESSYGNFKLILHPTMLSLMPEVEHLKLQIDFMLHQLRFPTTLNKSKPLTLPDRLAQDGGS